MFNFAGKRFWFALFSIVFLVFLDQFSKAYMIDFLKTQKGYNLYLNPLMNFVYTWNYGISFGLFSSSPYSNIIFLASNSLIILYLLASYLFNHQSSDLYLLVLGGGIGNLIDRFYRGAVFDFIHVHYYDYHFPVFNVADMFISVGIGLFILETLVRKNDIYGAKR